MKRGRIIESQIVSVLKEADAGTKIKELCRKHGISDTTYYNWKAKFGGVSISDLRRDAAVALELISAAVTTGFAGTARRRSPERNVREVPALGFWDVL